MEERNALIKKATITNEDHGCLSVWLSLDYGGAGQGFGGYSLYNPTHEDCCAGKFIWRCLEIAGVNNWHDLVGKTIRVKREHSKIHAIGHILKDDWFTPSEDL